MSSSDENSAIILTDTKDKVQKKIMKYAHSGGQQTVEEHRAKGADLTIDIPYQWLRFFMEDDVKLEDVRAKYSKGELLTGEVKNILIKEI